MTMNDQHWKAIQRLSKDERLDIWQKALVSVLHDGGKDCELGDLFENCVDKLEKKYEER